MDMKATLSSLTARQNEILIFMTKGCSNKEIAQLLGLTENTVKTHAAAIFERLQVSNRTEASVLYKMATESQAAESKQAEGKLKLSIFNDGYRAQGKAEELVQLCESLTRKIALQMILWEVIEVSIDVEEDGEAASDIPPANVFSLKLEPSIPEQVVILSLIEFRSVENRSKLLLQVKFDTRALDQQGFLQQTIKLFDVLMQSATDADAGPEYRLIYQAIHEAWSHDIDKQLNSLSICDTLISRYGKWSVPYSLRSMVLYKALVYGYLTDSSENLAKLSHGAREALKLNGSSCYSHYAFANFCLISSNPELAEQHLLKALEINPALHRAVMLLGQVQAFNGKLETGLQTLELYLADFPDLELTGTCYSVLAVIHYCLGNLKDSEKMANISLLYTDSAKTPVRLIQLSIANRLGSDSKVQHILLELSKQQNAEKDIRNALLMAHRIVPPAFRELFFSSLENAGLELPHLNG